MSFGDPLAAFANMRSGIARHERACFTCWQDISANPWVGLPQSRIDLFLPERPASARGIPGLFSFADRTWVAEILTGAVFAVPDFAQFEFELSIGRTLDEAVERSCSFGASGRLLAEQPDDVQHLAAEAVREALNDHIATDGSIALTGCV